MICVLSDDLVQVVILDVSGVYVQIHDQGWWPPDQVSGLIGRYSDPKYFRCVVI